MTVSRDREVTLARELAALARPIVLKHYRTTLTVDAKADLSPVTIADRDCEAAMRAAINRAFPDHGIIGEEYGRERADAEFVWVLDPIDGTKSFITGKPLFGTLIALTQAGKPIVGVIDMPALDECWWAADDRTSVMNGRPVAVRPCGALGEAMLYATSPHQFRGADEAAFARVAGAVRHPLYGADCYHYAMLAAGWSDIVVEASLQAYDFCACVPVVEGAGGVVTDWQGRPLTPASDGRVVACGDRRLLEPILARLSA
ncbi:MAG: histidinol-phosphatase [Alphaproteobacteria bacterium]|nr:histidinol-phosphatase [Alphaproteobacteria bacterium]